MDLSRPVAPDPYSLLPRTVAFAVASDDVVDGEPMPAQHTAEGGSVSPHLAWDGFPPGTQSFIVSCFDPDAPTPAGFWHWTMVDIPAAVTALPTGAGNPDGTGVPSGALQLRGDGGVAGYVGAAPPPGDRPHRYVFAVHALDVPELGVAPDTTPTRAAVIGLRHTLGRAIITPTFQR